MNDFDPQLPEPMTEESVRRVCVAAGARVASRSGRSDSYGAPRDFSFEVRAAFANSMSLQIVARQFNYRDPWEASGRVNDLVDLTLFYKQECTPLPKGYRWFQVDENEVEVDAATLEEIVRSVAAFNPKILELQRLTGDR